MKNKWLCGIIPALLLSMTVGQIYAFTLFSTPIAQAIGCTQQQAQIAFSLGIFFLGMGAAFFGKLVERNISTAAFCGGTLFLTGFMLTITSLHVKSIALLYVGYGLLLGLGTGIIYIVPVKTLMLWMPERKALASAIPIAGFGLGSSLCAALYPWYSSHMGSIFGTLCAFCGTFSVMMLFGVFGIEKPNQNSQYLITPSNVSYTKLFRDKFFWSAWIFMFVNISAGLALIPLAKQIMQSKNYEVATISVVLVIMGVMNGFGRFFFAWLSDKLRIRINTLIIISGLSALVCIWWQIPILALVVIPACYGAGFSCIPAIVYEKYGIDKVSTIHGAVLSAWGFAGLVGNQLALCLISAGGLRLLAYVLWVAYMLNLLNACYLRKHSCPEF